MTNSSSLGISGISDDISYSSYCFPPQVIEQSMFLFFLYSSLDRDDSRDLDYSSCSSSSPAAAVSNMVAGGGGAAASLPVLENPENQVEKYTLL